MNDFEKTLNKGFEELAIKIAVRYKANPENEIKSLALKSIRDPLLERYNLLVKENELKKIEDLPEDQKRKLWERSKRASEDQFERVAICKCLYLLDALI